MKKNKRLFQLYANNLQVGQQPASTTLTLPTTTTSPLSSTTSSSPLQGACTSPMNSESNTMRTPNTSSPSSRYSPPLSPQQPSHNMVPSQFSLTPMKTSISASSPIQIHNSPLMNSNYRTIPVGINNNQHSTTTNMAVPLHHYVPSGYSQTATTMTTITRGCCHIPGVIHVSPSSPKQQQQQQQQQQGSMTPTTTTLINSIPCKYESNPNNRSCFDQIQPMSTTNKISSIISTPTLTNHHSQSVDTGKASHNGSKSIMLSKAEQEEMLYRTLWSHMESHTSTSQSQTSLSKIVKPSATTNSHFKPKRTKISITELLC
ncbi:hypothetical protein C9374_006573 [Naegleria lovaniensis]|uniref:Uncharacterized protein n=1 Tax=Naegleria lovaniensis TaxID=51637 RepID=A0AA88GLR3_NAELO|nr:uncharacterized protein C9374_006573 [Naegleria lovaniensis]KAG2379456.1 hypothetical protein C9374_006573 [Naegleria lovaniensis]